MALDRLYQIQCDRCGEQSGFWQDTPRHARQAARQGGWLSMSRGTSEGYGFARLDYCPQCAEANYTGEGGDDAHID